MENNIENITFVTKKPKQCPFCGNFKIAKILYGLPDFSDKLQEKLESGKIVLGGCCVKPDSPHYKCLDCNTGFTVNREQAASIFTDPNSNYAMLVYGAKCYDRCYNIGYPEIQMYKEKDNIYTAKLYLVNDHDDNVKTIKSAKNIPAEFVNDLITQLRNVKINLFTPDMFVLDGGLSYLRLANYDVTLFITWNDLPDDWQGVEKAVELLTGIFPEFYEILSM